MRRLFTRLCAAWTFLILLASAGEAALARRAANTELAIQPLESRYGLVLFTRPGSARIESLGRRERVALAPDEQLTTISEISSGWVAAGVRQENEGSSLLFVAGEGGAQERLPPLRQLYPLQLRPVLSTLDGDLRGAAWLEGEEHGSLAVRFAEWTGLGWDRPETVSAPGPGSQTGLTAVALQNGELLLAWSRFDGKDDEIYWSLRKGSRWSRPARLGDDNATPDVTPVLAASDRGAILVWARLENFEYRLVSRRFESDVWAPERRIAGPGTMFPSLVRSEGQLFVIHRKAVPRGWSVSEVAEGTSIARHAFIEEASSARPVLAPSKTGARLEWSRPKRSANLKWEQRRP